MLFVKEAYKHGKAIASMGDGASLISLAARSDGLVSGQFAGPGVLTSTEKSFSDGFVKKFASAIAHHRFVEREDLAEIIA